MRTHETNCKYNGCEDLGIENYVNRILEEYKNSRNNIAESRKVSQNKIIIQFFWDETSQSINLYCPKVYSILFEVGMKRVKNLQDYFLKNDNFTLVKDAEMKMRTEKVSSKHRPHNKLDELIKREI